MRPTSRLHDNPLNRDRTRIDQLQSGKTPEHRRLPAPAWPNDDNALPLAHIQIEVFQDDAITKRLSDVRQVDNRIERSSHMLSNHCHVSHYPESPF
jgi:hypothetical protein